MLFSVCITLSLVGISLTLTTPDVCVNGGFFGIGLLGLTTSVMLNYSIDRYIPDPNPARASLPPQPFSAVSVPILICSTMLFLVSDWMATVGEQDGNSIMNVVPSIDIDVGGLALVGEEASYTIAVDASSKNVSSGYSLGDDRTASHVIMLVGFGGVCVSALVTHVLHGWRDTAGYGLWQPFLGGSSFVILQGFGWVGCLGVFFFFFFGSDFFMHFWRVSEMLTKLS